MPEDRQIGRLPHLDDSSFQDGKNWLLVIGINTYTRHKKLDKAVADAEGFHAVMTKKYGFEDLTPPLYEEHATQANIREAFGKCENLGEHDRLVIFYAGHGWYKPKSKVGYIVPSEAKDNPHTDFISTTFITDIFKSVDAKHILLIVDCCFGGSFGNFRNLHLEQTNKVATNLDIKRSRWVLSSGGIELVKDGYASANNSPFMTPLLNILQSNEQPVIILSDIFSLLRKKTHYNTEQMPLYKPLSDMGHDDGELILYCTDLETPVEKAYKRAITEDDIPIYEKFLRDFPQSIYETKINEFLKSKRTSVEWETIIETDNIEMLDYFIEHQNSRIEEVKKRKAELHEMEVKKQEATERLYRVQEEKSRAKEEQRIQREKIRKDKAEETKLQKMKDKEDRIEQQKQIEADLMKIKNPNFRGSDAEIIELLLKHQDNKAFDKDLQYRLGKVYQTGDGIEKNVEKAIMWYKKAADQGVIDAQRELGYMYFFDSDVEKDINEAEKWYKKAALKKDINAQINLGRIHLYLKNHSEALKWFEKAAVTGNAAGQFYLGDMYKLDKNYVEAIFWYKKSAEQGLAFGLYRLGDMYLNGYGVTKSINEAVHFYRLSAKKDNKFAKDALKRLGYPE